mmetsp:Transcript_4379/g.7763  ORF Transcript_4379/g.7763 Transcript_4379/m.7763 type:complete len:781 (+) Transcript_4379:106-2448(+)|eukprot:CAMPEP_0197662004 /NCGR_PEP_ID=MMETSP1338-20131121/51799_1 /TAXON_ID=43686 ORGANISM="Pelagodinium beii, Strain RCC1491" /NCGR_SAMPLE_ID=MMETSP1338 /ASSEMBLY_ACC=CAM_ASM_000754 /LENGTH=780 /DNA_ID=CAMNT_0043239671 /DNA_START=89 /DNA_END=2431 /DNA_ORIENTATION=+
MPCFAVVLLLSLHVIVSTVAAAKVSHDEFLLSKSRSQYWLDLIDAAPCDECQTRATRNELRKLGSKGLTSLITRLTLQVGEIKKELGKLDEEIAADLEKLDASNKNVTDKYPDINAIPLRIEDEVKLKKEIEAVEVLNGELHNETIKQLEAAKKERTALGEKVAEASSSTCWSLIAGYLDVKLLQMNSTTHRLSARDEPEELPRHLSDSQITAMVNDLSAGLSLSGSTQLLAGEEAEENEAAKVEELVRKAEELETERDELKAKETRDFAVFRQQEQRALDESTKFGQILYEKRIIVIREEEFAKRRVAILQKQLAAAKLFYAHEKPKLDRVKALTDHYVEKTKEMENLIQQCLCRIKKSFTEEKKTCCARQRTLRVTGNIHDPETCMAVCAAKGCTHIGWKNGVCELFKGCDSPEFEEKEKVYRFVKPPPQVGFFVNHDFETEASAKATKVKVVPFWEKSSGAVFVVQNNQDWGGLTSGSGRQYLGLEGAKASTSQKIEGLKAKEDYVVMFLAADRPTSKGAKLTVTADGTATTPVLTTSFARYEAPFTAKGTSAEIKFEQADADKAALIDAVLIDKDDHLRLEGDGHCAGEAIYTSKAWELGPSFEGEKDFNTLEYRKFRGEALRRCLTKDRYTKWVAVSPDAGYRCYKGEACKATGDGVRSWKYTKAEPEPKPEEQKEGALLQQVSALDEHVEDEKQAVKPILIHAEGQGDLCCRGDRMAIEASGATLDKCYEICASKDCRHVDFLEESKSCGVYGSCPSDATGYTTWKYEEKKDQR